MSKPNVKNFAKAELLGGYTAGALAVTLKAGHGAKLPEGPFRAVWWNVTDYPSPEDDPDVEIVLVGTHVIGSDTCSNISRGQEGTVATAKNIAGKTYLLMNVMTAAMYEDLPDGTDLTGSQIKIGATAYEVFAQEVDGEPVLKLRLPT